MLDVAVGTGLVSKAFQGRVARIVGQDLTEGMTLQARSALDELVLGRAEELPFPDASFDIVTCRQGIQFMDAPVALREMVRVLRPKGRIVLVDLCAYGPEDRDDYHEILRLRNPARANFWVRGDVADLLEGSGCPQVESHDYITEEDVDAWSDTGAIGEDRREGIRAVYRRASPAFLALHGVRVEEGRFVDRMLFTLTVGRKA